MVGDAPPIRPTLGDDDPLTNASRFPTELPDDGGRESPPAVGHGQEVVDIHDLGLELYQEERSRRFVPGNEIDDPALTEMVERHLWPRFPAGRQKHSRDCLGHRGMPGRDDAIHAGASPSRLEDEPDLEGCPNLPQATERHGFDVTTLDLGVRRR